MTILQFILALVQIISGIISIYAIISQNKTNSELRLTIGSQQEVNNRQQAINEAVEKRIDNMNSKIIDSLYGSLVQHTNSIVELATDIKILINGKITDKTKRV